MPNIEDVMMIIVMRKRCAHLSLGQRTMSLFVPCRQAECDLSPNSPGGQLNTVPCDKYKSLKPSTVLMPGPIMHVSNLIWLASTLYLTSIQASPAANVQRRGCRTASDLSCDFLLQRCAVNVCILNLPFPAKEFP